MLSHGSQLEENDLKRLRALFCMEKTSVVYCLDIMMFVVQWWRYS